MKKIKFISFMILVMLMLSGCNDYTPIKIYDYEPSSMQFLTKVKNSVYFTLKFDESLDDMYFTVEGPGELEYSLAIDSDCKKINDSREYKIIAKNLYYESPNRFSYGIRVYEDKACSGKVVASAKTKNFVVSDTIEIPQQAKDIASKIGGVGHYCNADNNGNYSYLGYVQSDVVSIAYSQIGYIYKSKNKNLNTCGTTSAGKTYDKYSDFIKISQKEVSKDPGNNFIRWVLNKAGSTVQLDDYTGNIIEWGDMTGRSYKDYTKMKDGDLRISNGPNGTTVSIIYQDINAKKWYSIGVRENSSGYYWIGETAFYDSNYSREIGSNETWRFIKMKGISY